MADSDHNGLSAQQERFCRFIVEGKNQRDAYRAAGYKCATDEAADANASRLISNAKVAARIAELRQGAAKKTVLNAAHFATRLERIAAAAERMAVVTDEATGVDRINSKDAADVARMCSMDAAKLLGQIVERSQVHNDNVNYNISSEPLSQDDWEREFADADTVGASARPPARAH